MEIPYLNTRNLLKSDELLPESEFVSGPNPRVFPAEVVARGRQGQNTNHDATVDENTSFEMRLPWNPTSKGPATELAASQLAQNPAYFECEPWRIEEFLPISDNLGR